MSGWARRDLHQLLQVAQREPRLGGDLLADRIGYLMTGSVLVGGAIAVVESLVNTAAYFVHEKVWESFRGRRAAGERHDPVTMTA